MSITLTASCSFIFPKNPWRRTYGGDGDDRACAIRTTPDGGYLAVGSTTAVGAEDGKFYILRLGADGDTVWTRALGKSGFDTAYGVEPTADEGGVVVGTVVGAENSGSHFVLLRIDGRGDSLWARSYGGTGRTRGLSICPASDAGFYAAGTLFRPDSLKRVIYLLRVDSSGDTIWTRQISGRDDADFAAVAPTTDGGCIIASDFTSSDGLSSAGLVCRVDPSGNTSWKRTFGSPFYVKAMSSDFATDGGVIVAGSESVPGSPSRAWLIRLSGSGESLRAVTYGDSLGRTITSVCGTSGNGFAATGTIRVPGSNNLQAYFREMDSTNQAAGEGYEPPQSAGFSVTQAPDSGFVFAGQTDYNSTGGFDALFVKMRSDGTMQVP